MAEDDHVNVDFEEGFAWIPAHVPQDCDDDDHLEVLSSLFCFNFFLIL